MLHSAGAAHCSLDELGLPAYLFVSPDGCEKSKCEGYTDELLTQSELAAGWRTYTRFQGATEEFASSETWLKSSGWYCSAALQSVGQLHVILINPRRTYTHTHTFRLTSQARPDLRWSWFVNQAARAPELKHSCHTHQKRKEGHAEALRWNEGHRSWFWILSTVPPSSDCILYSGIKQHICIKWKQSGQSLGCIFYLGFHPTCVWVSVFFSHLLSLHKEGTSSPFSIKYSVYPLGESSLDKFFRLDKARMKNSDLVLAAEG